MIGKPVGSTITSFLVKLFPEPIITSEANAEQAYSNLVERRLIEFNLEEILYYLACGGQFGKFKVLFEFHLKAHFVKIGLIVIHFGVSLHLTALNWETY